MPDIEIDLPVVDFIFQHIASLICIGILIFFLVRVADRGKYLSRPLGIWAWGIFLLTASVYNLINFHDYKYYRFMFQELPEPIVSLRYGFSILFRGVIIVAAFGTLYFKEWARKLLLSVALFTIATIYWKHPYYAFENIAIMIESNYFGAPVQELAYPAFPWITLFIYILFDLLTAGLIIYYFTLSEITGLYQKHAKPS